jgi:hypothetical protein
MADRLVNGAAATDESLSVTRSRARIPWHFMLEASNFEHLGNFESLANTACTMNYASVWRYFGGITTSIHQIITIVGPVFQTSTHAKSSSHATRLICHPIQR